MVTYRNYSVQQTNRRNLPYDPSAAQWRRTAMVSPCWVGRMVAR